MAHPCPRPGCPRMVPKRNIACQDDWHLLPTPLRREWVATSGELKSTRHLRAVMACLDWLTRHPV